MLSVHLDKTTAHEKVKEKNNNGKCRLYITREYISNGISGRGSKSGEVPQSDKFSQSRKE